MKQPYSDEALQAAFLKLRESDQGRVGAFSKTWRAVGDRVAAQRARALLPRWLLASFAAMLIAVVIIGNGTLRRAGPVHLPPTPISEWVAPSDVLLTTADLPLWRSTPQLGDSPVDAWNPTPQ